ncbi:hypothetical protein [Methylovulum psychrotolerans]|uniref:DUF2281 domain-containing protein n=1 Tax=Methylovulum psychrotolerans TaxID=1704499 RepID=A0A1Z4BYA5_9GAMM|nr:hypothetical protein [Methylovulum psychrotolerans]ASF46284.1 hypothetical protein CEK71_09440 [Methylovulum psychrotolerans]
MPTLSEEILHDLAGLPPEMQVETLDFIRFLKAKWAKNNALNTEAKPNGFAVAELLDNAAKNNLFASIDDPAAWQREIRQDRPLPGREE